MTVVNLPLGATNSGTNDWSDVHGEDQAIIDVVNGQITNGNLSGSAGITDANLASPTNPAYRTIYQTLPVTYGPDELGPATIYFARGSISDHVASPSGEMDVIYLDGADYAVAGKTAKLRLRAVISTNATAPNVSFTFGLYPVTVAGVADTMTYTAGAVTAGSTAVLTTPGASATTAAVSSEISFPTAGPYVVGIALSGNQANNSAAHVRAYLQYRNT